MARIESIEIYRVAMPLIYPFRTSFGDNDTIESVLLKITSGDLHGWGESAPWHHPAYTSECGAGVFMMIRDFLGPTLLGQEVSSGEELQKKLSPVKGNYFAKAALDLAWWDLHAKSRNQPLWKTLGGKKDVIDVGADFGVMESIDALLDTIDVALKAGFKRVKLKFRPGWDLDMVSAVREAFPNGVFHIDCNSAYTLDDAPMFKKLDRYNLAMIEQPLNHDDLIDHARLQQGLDTPICLDESIISTEKARKAIEIEACRWINIKPGRVGGLTVALSIHDICQQEGIPCWVGGMLESSVGAAHCIALATLSNFKYPSDIFPSDRFYKKDLSHPPITLSGPSEIKAFAGPGIGAEPNTIDLDKLKIESAVLQT